MTDTCQARFHRRWDHLHDVHVRALAWLLDAPDLLDPGAPQWGGRIAVLDIDRSGVAAWLAGLDQAPDALHAFLDMPHVMRLGRYAEKLMAFYFGWCGTLVAHGLQVRAARNETIGEFDFLLREADALVHLEFATKFYLFESTGNGDAAHYFIGPNLMDTLDAKMGKILNRQLALARHPAASAYLPQPVARAQALVKGWLFYHDDPGLSPVSPGVATVHCRGSWGSLKDFAGVAAAGFMFLPRLSWLAPARVAGDTARHAVCDHRAMSASLAAHFSGDSMPVMLASMAPEQDPDDPDGGQPVWRETARCFVVPDDWRDRAHERNQRTVLRVTPG